MRKPLSRMFGLGSNPEDVVVKVNIDKVESNPYQPRTIFIEEEIKELAESIKESGLLHPLVLRPQEDGYQIIAGERRLRALKMLGEKKCPAIIKDIDDQTMAQLALVENLQRKDLHFFEEALGYQRMLFSFNMTQAELGKKVGRSQSAIANKLRLLRLPTKLRESIIEKSLSERHARALLTINSPALQAKILEEVINSELSVAKTEALIAKTIEEENRREQKKNGSILKVFEDLRLYVNTLRRTVKEMKDWGLDVQVEEKDEEEYITFNITLPKKIKTEE